MQVDFYHLAASPLDRVLPRIAERIVAAGGRLLVVAADVRLLFRLDEKLWSYSADSFLPHGRAGRDGEGDQPVLLAETPDPINAARNIALVDGTWREEALAFDRCFHLFDDEALAAARLTWKALAGRDGAERRFWKQDDAGRWSQAA